MENSIEKNQNKQNKSKVIGIVIGLVVVAALAVGATYAYWIQVRVQNDTNSLVAACLDITMNEGQEVVGIDQNNSWPMGNNEAITTLQGYTFSVKNKCDQSVNYVIGLESIAIGNLDASRYLANSSVAVGIDERILGVYSELNDTSKIDPTSRDAKSLGAYTLTPNATDTHTLRLWIDSEAPVTEQNKQFSAKVTLTAGQNIINDSIVLTDEECFTITNDGTITAYDASCGGTVVLPATVNDIQVKTIASDAFRGTNKVYTNYQVNNPTPENMVYVAVDEINMTGIEASIIYSSGFDIDAVSGGTPLYAIMYDTTSATKSYYQAVLSQMGLSALPVYDVGDPNIPVLADGNTEVFYKRFESAPDEAGFKIASSTQGITITSLDLGNAIYLDKIEAQAFSNVPAGTDIANIEDYPYSLTNLTFGNNERAIEIGHGAFNRINVPNLTLYASLTAEQLNYYEGMPDAEFEAAKWVYGYFAYSNFTNLTLKPANSDKVFDEFANLGEIIGFGMFGAVTATNVIVEEGITTIGQHQFGALNAQRVSLPSTLVTIGEKAFKQTTLTSITIPASVTTIGKDAFLGMNGTITLTGGTAGKTLGENWNGNATVN